MYQYRLYTDESAFVHYAQVTGYRRPSTFEQYAEEFKQAILAKEKLTSLLREKNFKNLDDRETVTVYTGEASFRSPYEIVVKTDTDSFLAGRREDIHQYWSHDDYSYDMRYRG